MEQVELVLVHDVLHLVVTSALDKHPPNPSSNLKHTTNTTERENQHTGRENRQRQDKSRRTTTKWNTNSEISKVLCSFQRKKC